MRSRLSRVWGNVSQHSGIAFFGAFPKGAHFFDHHLLRAFRDIWSCKSKGTHIICDRRSRKRCGRSTLLSRRIRTGRHPRGDWLASLQRESSRSKTDLLFPLLFRELFPQACILFGSLRPNNNRRNRRNAEKICHRKEKPIDDRSRRLFNCLCKPWMGRRSRHAKARNHAPKAIYQPRNDGFLSVIP